MKNILFRQAAVLACASAMAFFGCSSDSDGGGSNNDAGNVDTGGGGGGTRALVGVFGNVVTTAGAPAVGATVEVGGATATTDAAGDFLLEVSPASDLVVSFRADGHLPVFLPVDVVADAASRVDATLMPIADPIVVDITTGGEATGARGAAVSIPAGALVTSAGVPVTGEVEVMLTPFDPTNEAEFAAYPGELTAEQTDGNIVQLQTYAVLDVTIMQNGEELDVTPGMTVQASIPVPDGLADTPETVGLWSFDEERGIWIEEGTATLDAEAGVYLAELPHLSPWNCDDPIAATCVEGVAVDATGAPVPGARVRAVGVDVFGSNATTAGPDGSFCVFAPPSSTVRISVIHGDGGGTIQEVTTGDTTLAEGAACGATCTTMGDVTITPGEVVIENPDGGGTTVDCADVGDPLVGTCAAGLSEMFECFMPSGQCVIRTTGASGSTTIEYDNGARIETTATMTGQWQAQYFGPGGNLCGTGSATDVESGTFTFTTANGAGPFSVEQDGNDQVIICPDGGRVELSSVEFDAFQACTGGGSTTSDQCTFDTGGGGVDLCAEDSDCESGQFCCEVAGNRICTDEEACSAFCEVDADCTEDGEVCCEVMGFMTCVDEATCTAAAGCSSDDDCEGGQECCTISGFSVCVDPGTCPG